MKKWLRNERIFLGVMFLFGLVYSFVVMLQFAEAHSTQSVKAMSTVIEPEVPVMVTPLVLLAVKNEQVPQLHLLTAEVDTDGITPIAGMSVLMESAEVSEVFKNNKAYTEEDLYLLAKLIHCEAGIDSMAGKLAVGTVVMNRMEHFNQKLFGGPTIDGVIYHKLSENSAHQFSCVDDERLWSEEPSEEAFEAAQKVLDGYRTFNDTYVYYYNPDLCDGIDDVICDLRIGEHVFGQE